MAPADEIGRGLSLCSRSLAPNTRTNCQFTFGLGKARFELGSHKNGLLTVCDTYVILLSFGVTRKRILNRWPLGSNFGIILLEIVTCPFY